MHAETDSVQAETETRPKKEIGAPAPLPGPGKAQIRAHLKKLLAQRKLSNTVRPTWPASALAGAQECSSWVLQWLVLSRASLQGPGVLKANLTRPNEPASHFPQSFTQIGAGPSIFSAYAPKATGRLHCLITTHLD
jgi:hypothetical protein